MTTREQAEAALSEIQGMLEEPRLVKMNKLGADVVNKAEGIKVKIEIAKANIRKFSLVGLQLNISEVQKKLDALQTLVDSLQNDAVPNGALGGVATNLEACSEKLRQIKEDMTDPSLKQKEVEDAKKVIEEAVKSLGDHIAKESSALRDSIKETVSELENTSNSALAEIRDGLQAVSKEISETLEEACDVGVTGFEKVEQSVSKFESGIEAAVSEVVNEFESFASLFGDLNEALPEAQGGVGVAKSAIEETTAAIEEALAFA